LPSFVEKLIFIHGVDPLKNLAISFESPSPDFDADLTDTHNAAERISSPVPGLLEVQPAADGFARIPNPGPAIASSRRRLKLTRTMFAA
jgi:hypothetical protein